LITTPCLVGFVSGYFRATGDTTTNCSVVGIWKPTDGTLPPANSLVMLADGTMHGVVTNIQISGGVCNFTGNYSIAKKDAFFVWHAQLVGCHTSTSDYSILKQLFCAFGGPTYTQSHMNFTAGCFAAFNPSCTQLQWTSFEGFDAGAGGVTTWDFSAPAPHTKKINEPAKINPVCSIKGVSASTIAGLPFPVQRYHHTTFDITYHHDTYKSRATYDDNAGTKCQVEWEGNYTISHRSEAYPNAMLYSYTSFGEQTKTATLGSPCTMYDLDPASCGYLSGDSNDRHDCFIVWDGFVDDPSCTYFRLFGHESTYSDASGPTFKVLKRNHGMEDKSIDSYSVDSAAPALFSLSFVFLLTFITLWLL